MSGFASDGVHTHRDDVALPNGATIVACSFPADGDHADREHGAVPAFGLYLDQRWRPPWPHRHLDWPDFGLPADDGEVVTGLEDVMDRIGQGQLVEIGCLGGHGRTGTAVACLGVLSGLDDDPVQWVRDRYCERAVETDHQVDYVRRFSQVRALYDRQGHRLA